MEEPRDEESEINSVFFSINLAINSIIMSKPYLTVHVLMTAIKKVCFLFLPLP